jgi:predicted secreted Zn-dependent protease
LHQNLSVVNAVACKSKACETSLEIVTTSPRWTNEADASPSLVLRWRAYYQTLLTHEDGHKAIAIEVTAAIRNARTNAQSPSNCADMARAIDKSCD